MIKLMPKWVLTNIHPAFYDSENGTILEQTAALYGKVNELIEDYNKLTEEVNKTITDYIESDKKETEEFEKCLISLVNNYIKTLDMKIEGYEVLINSQNEKIKDQNEELQSFINDIKSDVTASIKSILDEMITNGELDETILNSISTLDVKFNDLSARVETLESTTYVLKHDIVTEELVLEKVVGGE